MSQATAHTATLFSLLTLEVGPVSGPAAELLVSGLERMEPQEREAMIGLARACKRQDVGFRYDATDAERTSARNTADIIYEVLEENRMLKDKEDAAELLDQSALGKRRRASLADFAIKEMQKRRTGKGGRTIYNDYRDHLLEKGNEIKMRDLTTGGLYARMDMAWLGPQQRGPLARALADEVRSTIQELESAPAKSKSKPKPKSKKG